MEQIDEAQARIRQSLQHFECVTMMEPDVGERTIANVHQRAGDSVKERLGADEAMIGQQIGAVGEMLASAEADLEMERPRVAEQDLAVDRSVFGEAQLRQQPLDQIRLAGAQRAALGAAVEAAEGGRIVHGDVGEALLSPMP